MKRNSKQEPKHCIAITRSCRISLDESFGTLQLSGTLNCMQLYKLYVLLALLYTFNTWTQRLRPYKKLDTFNRWHIMRILCISYMDHVRNLAITSRTALVPVSAIVQKSRLSGFGHVMWSLKKRPLNCSEDRCSQMLQWIHTP